MIKVGDLVYCFSSDEPPITEEQALVGLVVDIHISSAFYSSTPANYLCKVLVGERIMWFCEYNLSGVIQ